MSGYRLLVVALVIPIGLPQQQLAKNQYLAILISLWEQIIDSINDFFVVVVILRIKL